MTNKREVPKGTKLHQLKKIGGFDLGLYYHEDETWKWEDRIEKFERLVTVMTEQLENMKKRIETLEE
jgi:hypothetical protein